jgi:hypothetical protein
LTFIADLCYPFNGELKKSDNYPSSSSVNGGTGVTHHGNLVCRIMVDNLSCSKRAGHYYPDYAPKKSFDDDFGLEPSS